MSVIQDGVYIDYCCKHHGHSLGINIGLFYNLFSCKAKELVDLITCQLLIFFNKEHESRPSFHLCASNRTMGGGVDIFPLSVIGGFFS